MPYLTSFARMGKKKRSASGVVRGGSELGCFLSPSSMLRSCVQIMTDCLVGFSSASRSLKAFQRGTLSDLMTHNKAGPLKCRWLTPGHTWILLLHFLAFVPFVVNI